MPAFCRTLSLRFCVGFLIVLSTIYILKTCIITQAIDAAEDQHNKRAQRDGIDAATSGLRLEFAVVVTRHGDRTPAHNILRDFPVLWKNTQWSCPSNPANTLLEGGTRAMGLVHDAPSFDQQSLNGLLGSCYLGQLTNKGHSQHKRLGRWLRARYVDQFRLLSSSLRHEQLRAESTLMQRTIDSVSSQLLGLYPADNEKGISRIDLHTTDLDLGDLIPNARVCPRLNTLLDAAKHTSVWKQEHEELQSFKLSVMQRLGISNEHAMPSWISLYDMFTCRRMHELGLPAGITDEEADRITQIAEREWALYLFSFDREYAKLGMQPLVSRIKRMMRERMHNSKHHLRFATLSAHDTTIAPLSAMLGIDTENQFRWPAYASNVIFELFRADADDFLVRVLRDGKPRHVEGCPDDGTYLCPFSQFDKVTHFFDDVMARCRDVHVPKSE